MGQIGAICRKIRACALNSVSLLRSKVLLTRSAISADNAALPLMRLERFGAYRGGRRARAVAHCLVVHKSDTGIGGMSGEYSPF